MEKRYYKTWEYNCAWVLSRLVKVVTDNGGIVVCEKSFNSYDKEYEIYNRTVMDAIYDATETVRKLNDYLTD